MSASSKAFAVLLLLAVSAPVAAQEVDDDLDFISSGFSGDRSIDLAIRVRVGLSAHTMVGPDARSLRDDTDAFAAANGVKTARIGMVWMLDPGLEIDLFPGRIPVGLQVGVGYRRHGANQLFRDRLNRDNVALTRIRTDLHTLRARAGLLVRLHPRVRIVAAADVGLVVASNVRQRYKLVLRGNTVDDRTENRDLETYYGTSPRLLIVSGVLGLRVDVSRRFEVFLEGSVSSRWFGEDGRLIYLQPFRVEPGNIDLRSAGFSLGVTVNLMP